MHPLVLPAREKIFSQERAHDLASSEERCDSQSGLWRRNCRTDSVVRNCLKLRRILEQSSVAVANLPAGNGRNSLTRRYNSRKIEGIGTGDRDQRLTLAGAGRSQRIGSLWQCILLTA